MKEEIGSKLFTPGSGKGGKVTVPESGWVLRREACWGRQVIGLHGAVWEDSGGQTRCG